ncbi:MAG TPA: sortase [Candidatus Dormibacteraeota bacterium]|nr:sortase [Candidatus Dormibacteraeota bacterium]
MNLRGTLALAAVAAMLAACGAAPAKAPATASYPPRQFRADPIEGADVPAPTPTPMPHSGLMIKIPQLGISLNVVEGHGLEPDYNLADHYPGMKWPGEGGRSFIYAHAQPGMFGALLGSGAVGEHVQIDEPDGRVLHYTIATFTRNWPVTDTSILQPADHEELVLYTCTSWTYADPKVVAVAEPDPQFVTG